MADVLPLIQQAGQALLGGSLPPPDLLKMLISKMLGYGILVCSTLVKLPQVFNILRSHSADGLSAVSFELESWGLLVHTSYGFLRGLPFSTYGEAATMFVQNVVILALIYSYNRMPASRRLAAVIMAAGAIAAVLSGHVSMPLIAGMYDLNNFILLGARLPQIAKNFTSRSTGQLSIITYAANTLGCIARLFTTVQEGGGSAMLRSYLLSLLLNSILVGQILVLGNKGVAPAKAKAKGKAA